jgi:hypothetical protein
MLCEYAHFDWSLWKLFCVQFGPWRGAGEKQKIFILKVKYLYDYSILSFLCHSIW